METKRCNKCGDDLPVTAFKKHRGTCIECNRKQQRERNYQRYHEEPDYKKKRQAATARYRKTDAYHKLWASEEHRQKERRNARKAWQRLKAEIIAHYSHGTMKCSKCSHCDIRALTIDHINNNGAAHRAELKRQGVDKFYHWLKRSGWPKGFQVLCMNCQWEKRWDEGDLKHD
jgi:hypothetical protein